MDEIYKMVQDIRSMCDKYSDEFANQFGEDDPRTRCFAAIFNSSTMTTEVISYYRVIWSKKRHGLSEERIEQERLDNSHRCVEITKQLYISVMSALEFYIRSAIAMNEEHILRDCIDRKEKLVEYFDDIYDDLPEGCKTSLRPFRKLLIDTPPFDSFRRIIDKSESRGLLKEDMADFWRFAIEVRNSTVHNDMIAWKTIEINVDGRNFKMQEKQHVYDKIDYYLYLLINLLGSAKAYLAIL
jgi:hypothetical protein